MTVRFRRQPTMINVSPTAASKINELLENQKEKVVLIKGKFRIGPGRSVLVRAKLARKGLEVLEAKRTLRGVASKMAIVDASNGERGAIVVNLVRRPKASLLPGGGK